jgi:hypothetical protein
MYVVFLLFLKVTELLSIAALLRTFQELIITYYIRLYEELKKYII